MAAATDCSAYAKARESLSAWTGCYILLQRGGVPSIKSLEQSKQPWNVIMGNATVPETLEPLMVQDGRKSPIIYVCALGAIALGLVIQNLTSVSVDPREPPILRPRIPIVGHLVGLLQHHGVYLMRLL